MNWKARSEIATVEFDHNALRYTVIFNDGECVVLDSVNLAEAQREAKRLVDIINDALDNDRYEQS